MTINIPRTDKPRVVIVGAGFAGLTFAQKIRKLDFQIVLIDQNNFHQFQPLFYQVAMAGLEPSSISFPIRKIFQKTKNIHFRMTDLLSIDEKESKINTTLGDLEYDHLIIATGVTTNFYGNKKIADKSLPLKSVSQALKLRNEILMDYEKAVTVPDYDQRQPFIDIVVVGGGPTGVEVAGALAEMKQYVLPKDYQELDPSEVDIYLIEGSDRLLNAMSEESSAKALKFLQKLGVKVKLNTIVKDYEDEAVYTNDGEAIPCRKLIWAAGITGNKIDGLSENAFVRGNRIKVDEYNRVVETNNIFALGDIAYMTTDNYENGHPQVAQGAIQQARQLASNFKKEAKGKEWKSFKYKDLGSMATIGRNKAVADLPGIKFQGFIAWLLWLVVHLKSILGVKNKIFVLFNWMWNYVTYDQSLRLIIRPQQKKPREN